MWSRKLIDLTGVRFGRLRVIGLADVKRYNKPAWLCCCDCGRVKVVPGNSPAGGEDPKLRVLAQGDCRQTSANGCCREMEERRAGVTASSSALPIRKAPGGGSLPRGLSTERLKAPPPRQTIKRHLAYGSLNAASISSRLQATVADWPQRRRSHRRATRFRC
jgi:hypothetical protein